MKRAAEYLSGFVLLVWWLAGTVIAKGFWSTAIACCFPPWAMYLLVERVLKIAGIA